MKKLSYLVLIISLLILTISIAGWGIRYNKIQKITYYANVNVTDSLGIDVNGTALIFGNLINTGSSTRYLMFQNNNNYPVILKLKADGSIGPYIHFEDNIRVEKGESKRIGVSAIMNNADFGIYDGNVDFLILPA